MATNVDVLQIGETRGSDCRWLWCNILRSLSESLKNKIGLLLRKERSRLQSSSGAGPTTFLNFDPERENIQSCNIKAC